MHNKALTFAKVTDVGYVAYPTPDLDGGGPGCVAAWNFPLTVPAAAGLCASALRRQAGCWKMDGIFYFQWHSFKPQTKKRKLTLTIMQKMTP